MELLFGRAPRLRSEALNLCISTPLGGRGGARSGFQSGNPFWGRGCVFTISGQEVPSLLLIPAASFHFQLIFEPSSYPPSIVFFTLPPLLGAPSRKGHVANGQTTRQLTDEYAPPSLHPWSSARGQSTTLIEVHYRDFDPLQVI